MSQSKKSSLTEISLNISSGFIISWLMMTFVVAPLYDLPVTYTDNLAITMLFTVSAIMRGYFWRRLFNSFTR
jgi:hypothetical protein